MQFQVPQNITFEDRIAGSLTAIQFAIVVIGGGISFFTYTSTSVPDPINKGLGGFLAIITLSLTWGKFNGQPLYRFFRHIFEFIFSPKTRVWHKAGTQASLITSSPHKDPLSHSHTPKKVSREDIANLAVVLDSRGTVGIAPKLNPPHE